MSGGERSVEERLSAYLDGELPPGERAELERALAEDEGLRRHLAELSALDELARERPADVVPEGYFETLPGRVRGRLPRRHAGPPRWVWPAAAAAVLAAALPVLRRPEAPPPVAEPPVRSASRELASPPPEPTPAPAVEPARTALPEEVPGEPAAPPPPVAPTTTVPALAAPPPEPERDAEPEPELQAPPTRPLRRPARRLAAAPAQLAEGRSTVDPAREERGAEGDDAAIEALRQRDATTLEELRQLREAWRALVDLPGEAGDEARIRVVELGLEAYRMGDDPVDLRKARRDAAAYLTGLSTPRVEGLRRRLEELE